MGMSPYTPRVKTLSGGSSLQFSQPSPPPPPFSCSDTDSNAACRWKMMLIRAVLYLGGFVLVALALVPFVAQTRLLRISVPDPEYHQAPILMDDEAAALPSIKNAPPIKKSNSHVPPPTPAPAASTTAAPRFAYAYVVGGCDPDRPAYRNFLYNILINTDTIRSGDTASTADVVVFVQMAAESQVDRLPRADEDMMTEQQQQQKGEGAGRTYIEYIPKATANQTLDDLMMEKFRIVSLTQYDRVLYLDSDVVLREPMDYLLDLSMQGTLQPNVVFASDHEPASGTVFLLTPSTADWEHMEQLLVNSTTGVTGWGQSIPKNDEYLLLQGTTKGEWDFRGADADAGLLYFWVRYVKNDFSTILSTTVRNWNSETSSELKLADLLPHAPQNEQPLSCWKGTHGSNSCVPPHSSLAHFPGSSKPWLHAPPQDHVDLSESPLAFWFHKLGLLNKRLSLDIDIEHWDTSNSQVPLLGLSGETEMAGTVYHEPETKIESPYSHHNTTTAHRFAYAYVIGGCKPEDPSYRNYLNDIMVSTYAQREEGSTADVVVFIQMAFESEYDALTDEDMRLMDAMEIRILYIPKSKDESFYRIMLDKFRVLSLVEYDRVIFMDGDVMTRGSLDYLFDLSMRGVLKENLVFAGVTEPANGGFFMVAPKEGSTDRIHDIISEKETRGAKLPYPHWDVSVGWGHVIEAGDRWQFINKRKNQTTWEFYGAFADQGLLFHWVKYDQKSVSIVFRNEVEQWGVDAQGKVTLEKTDDLKIFGDRIKHKCWRGLMKMKPCEAPHSDFVHFTGRSKPWLAGPPEDLSEETKEESASHVWFYTLGILNEKMNIGLDFNNWRKGHRPFLGMFPLHKDAATTKYNGGEGHS